MMTVETGKIYLLEEFRLEPEKRVLSCDGKPARLANRPFQVLLYLIENRERIVTRDELLEQFWDNRDVYDTALTKCVGAIRKALNEPPDEPRFIETRWAEGYRFIGKIEEQPPQFDSPSVEKKREMNIPVATNGNGNKAIPAAKGFGGDARNLGQPDEKTKQTFAPGNWQLKIAAVFIILMLIVIGWGFSSFRQAPSPINSANQNAPINSIAVLPFKNLTGNTEREIFSDGMTESLIGSLSKIDNLKVISRNSVFTFKNKDVDPREIGKQLGVAAVLEGSVRESNDKIRVEVRLVNTADGQILWSGDNYDRALGDVFEIQDDIARSVTTKLRLKLSSADEKQLAPRQSINTEAYQSYLKAMSFRNQMKLPKAVEFFNEALRLEPNYAPAHEGLAGVYTLMEINSQVPPGTAAPLAESHANRALELDENSVGAYLALGVVKTLKNYDLDERIRYYREAIRRNPNFLTAHRWLSSALLAQGKFEEAEAELLFVQEIDPLSYGVRLNFGELYYYWGKPDQAIEQANLMLVANPGETEAYNILGKAYFQKKMLAESAAAFQKYDPKMMPISILTATGRIAEAKKEAEKFAAGENAKTSPYNVACAFAASGEREKALAWLEKAYELRQADLISMKIDPALDKIRDDARFEKLQQRIGL